MYTHDIGDGESPSVAVIKAIAAATETPIEELEPIYKCVDPDALDAILASACTPKVSFIYSEIQVAVNNQQVQLEIENNEET